MTTRAQTFHSKSFPSDPAVLEDFYTWLEKVLGGLALGKKDADRAVIASGEAFSNALQHGNRANPQKKVAVEVSLAGLRLRVRIGDEGPGSLPHASKKSGLFDTSGRGWELMHKLADELSIRRENGFFWVELSFKMPKDYTGKLKANRGKKGVGKVRSGRR